MSSLQQRCDFMMNVAQHALIMGIKLDEFQKLAIAAYGVLESPAPETRAGHETGDGREG